MTNTVQTSGHQAGVNPSFIFYCTLEQSAMPQQVTGWDGMLFHSNMIFHSNTDNFTSSVLNLMGVMAVPGYVGSISQIWNTTGIFLQWSNDTFASFFSKVCESLSSSLDLSLSRWAYESFDVISVLTSFLNVACNNLFQVTPLVSIL